MTSLRYIHANYRFIVDPNGDFRSQATDADVHLDWSNVLQILVSAQSQSTNCPICLSNPVAPRMAKCGHIFCLPCLIRFMHSSDDVNPLPEKKARWKKCPICWDSIYISEARPVRWFTGQEGERPREGGDVVLRLIMRQPGSTLALPRDGAEALNNAEDIPWYFAAEVMDYARVMKGSEDYMTHQYRSEIIDLQQQEKEDELMFGEETQWTKKAASSISDAIERVKGIGNPPTAPQQPSERTARRVPLDFHEGGVGTPDYLLVHHATKSGQSSSKKSVEPQNVRSGLAVDQTRPRVSSHTGKGDGHPATISTITKDATASELRICATGTDQSPPLRVRERSSATLNGIQNDSPFFFYEALLHLYLSPLDIRILKAAFGDYASFPSTILPRVERISTGHIVDDELRRRAKYLAHLPHGCEVGFLECDWTDIVSPEILGGFLQEVERRRKRNREKEVREEKERVRAEKEEDDKRWAAARRRRPTPSQDVISEEDFQPLPEASVVDFVPPSSSPPWSSSRAQGGSTFATLASPSTSPAASKTVWGTSIVAPASPSMPAASQEPEPSESDGWLQNWESDLLQEEELVTQLEASTLVASSSKQETPSANARKKKGKKIMLMTTNARRGA